MKEKSGPEQWTEIRWTTTTANGMSGSEPEETGKDKKKKKLASGCPPCWPA